MRAAVGRTAAALLAVVALAAFFRLHRLETVPPGLYLDEVLVARRALAWRLAQDKNWFAGTPLLDAGRDQISNLYLAATSGVLWLFGDDFLAARMVSVLPSILCVPLLYALARMVAGSREALVAATLLAVSHWGARTGRVGWFNVAMVALQLAALAGLARGLGTDRLAWSAAAGVPLGACLYTYLAARLVPFQVGAWLAWEAFAGARGRRALAHAALALGVAALFAAPHYLYLMRSGALTARMSEVGLTAVESGRSTWGTLAGSVVAHLAMFHARGGTYARDNLPGWPMLDPVSGLLLLVGLAVLARRPGPARRLAVTWFAVAILSGVLSHSREGPPYVFRVASLAPWACLVAGIGAVALWDRLRGRAARLAGVLAFAGAVVFNFWILFVRGPECPDFGPAFGTVETRLGLWLRRHRADRPAVVFYDAVGGLDGARPDLWYPETNGYNWYGPLDSSAAIQLAAGVYRRSPARALDPAALHGDVDVVARLPAAVTRPTLFVVPPGLVDTVARVHAIDHREDLHDELGRTLCTILAVRPR